MDYFDALLVNHSMSTIKDNDRGIAFVLTVVVILTDPPGRK